MPRPAASSGAGPVEYLCGSYPRIVSPVSSPVGAAESAVKISPVDANKVAAGSKSLQYLLDLALRRIDGAWLGLSALGLGLGVGSTVLAAR